MAPLMTVAGPSTRCASASARRAASYFTREAGCRSGFLVAMETFRPRTVPRGSRSVSADVGLDALRRGTHAAAERDARARSRSHTVNSASFQKRNRLI